MAAKKEAEKHEKIIRGLVRLRENRNCINCGSLGPQYVCSTFSVYVCTACSGVHREFSHRIKSVSMSNFTPDEVAALQAGGNERARQTLMREYDVARNGLPDNNNPDRLREFIRAVYVDKRYTGERPPPKTTRSADRDDLIPPRRFSDTRGGRQESERFAPRRADSDTGSRYEDRRYEDRRYDERASGVVGRMDSDGRDREYDDRPPNDRRLDPRDRRSSTDQNRRSDPPFDDDRRSSRDDPRRSQGYDDSPPLRPVRDILGQDAKLRIGSREFGQSNGHYDDDTLSQASRGSSVPGRKDSRTTQDEVTGSNRDSENLNRQTAGSLIDFAAESESTATSVQQQAVADPFAALAVATTPGPQLGGDQFGAPPTTSWATFDSNPAFGAAPVAGPGFAAPFLQAPAGLGPMAPWAAQAHLAPLSGGMGGVFGVPLSQPHLPLPYQARIFHQAAHLQPQASDASVQSHQQGGVVAGDSNSLVPTETPKQVSSERREIPEDFFVPDSFMPPVVPGVIYPPVAVSQLYGVPPPPYAPFTSVIPGSMPAFSQPPKSRNPFDDPPGPASDPVVQPLFPNMGSVQAALPPYTQPPTLTPVSWGTLPPTYLPSHQPPVAYLPPGGYVQQSGAMQAPPNTLPGGSFYAAPAYAAPQHQPPLQGNPFG
eukprot:SM000125S26044  [mRNA]  locus=s125:75353:80467:+ [translate_table: standard]